MKTHIAYEWQQFIVPDYKKSATACGAKSTRYGIPGISEDVDEWCPRCSRSVAYTVERLDASGRIKNEHVKALYREVWFHTYAELEAYRARQEKERAVRNAVRSAKS